MKNKIFKVEKFPFLELRYLSHVTSCDKAHKHDELTITAIKNGCINIEFDSFTDNLRPNELSIHSCILNKKIHLAKKFLTKWCWFAKKEVKSATFGWYLHYL